MLNTPDTECEAPRGVRVVRRHYTQAMPNEYISVEKEAQDHREKAEIHRDYAAWLEQGRELAIMLEERVGIDKLIAGLQTLKRMLPPKPKEDQQPTEPEKGPQ